MYEARYWGILSAYTILHVKAGFIHIICLGISNRSVAVPRQDSIHPYRALAVLSGHCNIYQHFSENLKYIKNSVHTAYQRHSKHSSAVGAVYQ